MKIFLAVLSSLILTPGARAGTVFQGAAPQGLSPAVPIQLNVPELSGNSALSDPAFAPIEALSGPASLPPAFDPQPQTLALPVAAAATPAPGVAIGLAPTALETDRREFAAPEFPVGAPAIAAQPDGPVSAARETALGSLEAAARPPAREESSSAQLAEIGKRTFDGAVLVRDPGAPAVEPAFSFEPPALRPERPVSGPRATLDEEEAGQRPTLSFPAAWQDHLLATDPASALRGAIKLIRETPSKASELWWNQYKRGAQIDIVSRDENVFGRPTVITYAATKRIEDLSRKDFEGLVPAHQLKLGVRELRSLLIAQLEEKRKAWNPNDPPVSLRSRVRVIRFKPFVELFRETHGPDAVPQPEAPAPRSPLKVLPEGPLKALSFMLPRAVFLDMDLFDGPVSKEILSDMVKLQRTGVYFIAFSRKPFESPGSIKDRLLKLMTSYQISTLMPIRFLAVTDDGAVVSALGKNGDVRPLSVLSFTSELDALRDAASKAAEAVGISPRALQEVQQPGLDAGKGEGFFDRLREAGEERESVDPRVRFELKFPKSVQGELLARWKAEFERRLAPQRLKVFSKLAAGEDGRFYLSVQKTDLAGSLGRLHAALQEQFGLYLNPSDILVLSADPALRAALPGSMDFGNLSGLKGAEVAENALGLMLGEHRENVEGDLAGSASRMAQYNRDRKGYMTQLLREQDQAEQNINFFSGHVVHSANDWLIWNLQNGRRPSREEYEAHVRERWDAGLRKFKPVGLPPGHEMEGWVRESVRRGLSMYEMMVKIHDRGETILGTEIPNFFIIKDYQRKSGELKRRHIVHTIFDFVALRPVPGKPGHFVVVIYDFKTGPAQSLHHLNKDLQVLTYTLFAKSKWVDQDFPVPYLSGGQTAHIDDVQVEFLYNAVKLRTAVDDWKLAWIRKKIINTFARIHATEQKLLGDPKAKAPKGSRKAVKTVVADSGDFDTLTLPKRVSGIKIQQQHMRKILAGTKKIEYRTMPTRPKAFIALIETYPDQNPRPPAQVVGFARIEKVTKQANGVYRWHLSHVTPVEPYKAPLNAGAVIWTAGVPVRGATELREDGVKKNTGS